MMIIITLFLTAFQLFCIRFLTVRNNRRFSVKNKLDNGFKSRRKPDWVRHKLIQFKANDMELSSRKLAGTFNRQFGYKETVSHEYVCYTLRDHKADVLLQRRQLKKRVPVIGINNRIWGVDLTGRQIDDKTRFILGVIDHGTRACMALDVLPNKGSLSIIHHLLNVIKRFGLPKVIRTDNEAIFTSRWFILILRLLGIKHQRIDLGCPWQNGRIERFFRTFKEKLNQLNIEDTETLATLSGEFRFWYNHVRTHQSLKGYTPAEVWGNKHPNHLAIRYSAWKGLLRGYYHLSYE